MRHTTRLLAVALALGLATHRCPAAEVDVPRGTTLPKTIDLDSPPWAWVVYDGYEPLRSPGGSVSSGAPAFRFMQPGLTLTRYQPAGGGEYLLFVKVDAAGKAVHRLGRVRGPD